MSGYILCQTKKADKPFFVESINTNIYSLEELCYFLYHNLYLVDSSVINENLCIWISEELDLPRLAAKLRPHLGKFASAEDVLYPVFKEINYLTYDELKALNVKLAKLDQEAPLLRKKRKGDALVANKMYVSAIKVYQQLLKKEGLEQIQEYEQAIFWSFSRKEYQKTNWWSKTANSSIGSKLTIRTANTVWKIVGM